MLPISFQIFSLFTISRQAGLDVQDPNIPPFLVSRTAFAQATAMDKWLMNAARRCEVCNIYKTLGHLRPENPGGGAIPNMSIGGESRFRPYTYLE